MDVLLWPLRIAWGLLTAILGLVGSLVLLVIALVLLITGAALTVTGIGAFIGIPLLVIGLLLAVRAIF
jgi:hypothetical protein